jgi:hypothetical protein
MQQLDRKIVRPLIKAIKASRDGPSTTSKNTLYALHAEERNVTRSRPSTPRCRMAAPAC